MHVNPHCYPPCSKPGGGMRPPTPLGEATCRCAYCRRTTGLPVTRRARHAVEQVTGKLRDLERALGWDHAARGPGPLQARLADLGGVRPLISSAFGGVNDEWRGLLRLLAETAAPGMHHRLLLPSVGQTRRVLYAQLCQRSHFQLARDRTRLLNDRLAALCGNGGAPADRTGAYRAREDDRRGSAHAARHARRRE